MKMEEERGGGGGSDDPAASINVRQYGNVLTLCMA